MFSSTFVFYFLRHAITVIFVAGLVVPAMPATAAPPSNQLSAQHLQGPWCLMEMHGNGIRVPENIELQLMSGGRYRWKDGSFVTDGRWEVTQTALVLSSAGHLPAILVGPDDLRLEPPKAVWHLRRGKCPVEGISQQDIVALHAAAGRADLPAVQNLLGRGVSPDMQDFVSGDTALILAAKFCKPSMVHYFLEYGANKLVRNFEGLTALEYAVGNATHRACPSVKEMLR